MIRRVHRDRSSLSWARSVTSTTPSRRPHRLLVPFAGLIRAMVLVWGHGFDWLNLGLLIGMYVASGLGVTVGYHRLFAHRAFATSRIVHATLAMLGPMAVEGPLLRWVVFHRSHHQHSDRNHDPHFPHTYGAGLRNGLLLM